MNILIEYRDEMVVAKITGDHKVEISNPDRIRVVDGDNIELDQCKKCGVWHDEDQEMYGDGYCENCAVMCPDCELYHHVDNVNANGFCGTCQEKLNAEFNVWFDANIDDDSLKRHYQDHLKYKRETKPSCTTLFRVWARLYYDQAVDV